MNHRHGIGERHSFSQMIKLPRSTWVLPYMGPQVACGAAATTLQLAPCLLFSVTFPIHVSVMATLCPCRYTSTAIAGSSTTPHSPLIVAFMLTLR